MAIAKSARVHPTAVIDPEADLGEEVQVGPFAVIEGPVRVGPGCVIKAGAQLMGALTLGEGDVVHGYAVLGDDPQHTRFSGESGTMEIGDRNVFREHTTVHRPATRGGVTRIGHRNYILATSHIANDCTVGNNCTLANASVLAAHCPLADNVYMSGHSAMHQFCRVGGLAMISGVSATTLDVPPFMIIPRINVICG